MSYSQYHIMRKLFLIICCLPVFGLLKAQQFGGHPPSTKWNQINTDTLRVIFPAGSGLGKQATDIAATMQRLAVQTWIRQREQHLRAVQSSRECLPERLRHELVERLSRFEAGTQLGGLAALSGGSMRIGFGSLLGGLITGGATREPIDGIRFLSNVSTGQTAAKLADRGARTELPYDPGPVLLFHHHT